MIFLWYLVQLYVVALIAYAVMSWIRLPYDSPWEKVQKSLALVCEPILRPVRRILPTADMGGARIDLSLTIVVLVLEVVVAPLIVR